MERAATTTESPEFKALHAKVKAHPQRAARHIIELEKKLKLLEEERRLERAKRFGASTERGEHQYRLFDEAEAHAEDEPEEDNTPIQVAGHTKRRPKRQALPKDLPRIIIDHELAEADRQCECGQTRMPIGVQTSEQLDIIPAQAFVIEHRRHSYGCGCCDAPPASAPLPAQPIPKSLASPGLLAHMATSKYIDGLPLYRQSAQLKRHGIALPRQTMAGHMVKAGALIAPLIQAITAHLTRYDVLAMDETPVQVLKEPGKTAQSQSYMWVMKGGPPDQPGVIYHYAPSRSGEVPVALLSGYAGYLQTDGYAGYGQVCRNTPAITGLGCWAHARRKFTDAAKALSKKARHNKAGRVFKALKYIEALYRIEREHKDADAKERYQARQEQSQPILDQFKTWLQQQSVPPKSLLGKAIAYTLAEWLRLIVYLDDGRLSMDNNGVENAIRPFAVGRKNWLFSASQAGATASANLYSLIETAKANGINEYAYLKMIFTELPAAGNNLDHLLPWNVDPQQLNQMLEAPALSTT